MKDDHKTGEQLLSKSPVTGEEFSEPGVSVNRRKQSMQFSEVMMEITRLVPESNGELVVVIIR